MNFIGNIPTCLSAPLQNQFIYKIPAQIFNSFFEFCEIEDLKIYIWKSIQEEVMKDLP